MDKLYQIDVTKYNISEALLDLMKKKPFSAISITELAEAAGIGRATFYRNFDSKESVLKYYLDTVIKRFKIPTKFVPHTDEGYYATLVYILRAVEKNKRIIKRVLDAGLALVALDYLDEQYERLFTSVGRAPGDYMPYLYSGAVFNLVRHWILGGCTTTAEEIAEAIFTASTGKNYVQVLLERKSENAKNANKD